MHTSCQLVPLTYVMCTSCVLHPKKNPQILSTLETCTLNIMHTSCRHHADIIYTTCQHHAFFLWVPTPQIWQTHPHNMRTSCTQHANDMPCIRTPHIIFTSCQLVPLSYVMHASCLLHPKKTHKFCQKSTHGH